MVEQAAVDEIHSRRVGRTHAAKWSREGPARATVRPQQRTTMHQPDGQRTHPVVPGHGAGLERACSLGPRLPGALTDPDRGLRLEAGGRDRRRCPQRQRGRASTEPRGPEHGSCAPSAPRRLVWHGRRSTARGREVPRHPQLRDVAEAPHIAPQPEYSTGPHPPLDTGNVCPEGSARLPTDTQVRPYRPPPTSAVGPHPSERAKRSVR